MHISFLKKKKKKAIDLWQWHCRNRREKIKNKKIVEWICENSIAKIGRKKNWLQLVCGNDIAEIWGKFCGNCGNAIAENGKEKKK